jgi:hypothetical protein
MFNLRTLHQRYLQRDMVKEMENGTITQQHNKSRSLLKPCGNLNSTTFVLS